jgi:hypothetical protein
MAIPAHMVSLVAATTFSPGVRTSSWVMSSSGGAVDDDDDDAAALPLSPPEAPSAKVRTVTIFGWDARKSARAKYSALSAKRCWLLLVIDAAPVRVFRRPVAIPEGGMHRNDTEDRSILCFVREQNSVAGK